MTTIVLMDKHVWIQSFSSIQDLFSFSYMVVCPAVVAILDCGSTQKTKHQL